MFNAIGIKAIVCASLVKEGRLVALMAVHQAEPRRWTDGEVALVFNTTEGWQSLLDSKSIRAGALEKRLPYYTTASAALAVATAITEVTAAQLEVRSLQDYYS